MYEDLYTIYLDTEETVVLLTDKRCISKAMQQMNKFVIQLKTILDYSRTDVLKDLDNINNCKYILHLFFSSMPEELEYSLETIASIDTTKYNKTGKVCVTNDIRNAYCMAKHSNKQYGLFI